MKALPVEKLPEGDWLYGIKFDGYRALAFKDGKSRADGLAQQKGVRLPATDRCFETLAG
jgi:hypothetical protein